MSARFCVRVFQVGIRFACRSSVPRSFTEGPRPLVHRGTLKLNLLDEEWQPNAKQRAARAGEGFHSQPHCPHFITPLAPPFPESKRLARARVRPIGIKRESERSMANQITLLLVEDNLAVREALTKVLISENYTVRSASSQAQAVLTHKEQPIDLVSLDLNLGDEDGWKVFQALKEIRPDLPIIVTSAQSDR